MLDTCTFVFATTDPEMLSRDVLSLFEDYNNEFCISIETVRELIIAFKNKGLSFKHCNDASEIIKAIKDIFYFTILPLQEEQMQTYSTLVLNESENHRDPSDHVIYAMRKTPEGFHICRHM